MIPVWQKFCRNFEQAHTEDLLLAAFSDDDTELNKKFAAWVQLSLSDRYAVAQETLEKGKLQRNTELLFQVAALFKASAADRDFAFAFLQHFYQQLLAKISPHVADVSQL